MQFNMQLTYRASLDFEIAAYMLAHRSCAAGLHDGKPILKHCLYVRDTTVTAACTNLVVLWRKGVSADAEYILGVSYPALYAQIIFQSVNVIATWCNMLCRALSEHCMHSVTQCCLCRTAYSSMTSCVQYIKSGLLSARHIHGGLI